MTNTFKRDLKRGEQVELALLDMIKVKYPKAHKVQGYFKDYDIYVPEIEKSIEVKYDEKSKYTGNIVIEVSFNGNPSALSTSKADYWVWWDGEYLSWFTIDLIKKCLKENKTPIRTFIGKGDSKSKNAYLVKKDLLYKYAIKQVETNLLF
tara:strand:- start:317 stop:766 length:450 start_codon:yes stop_codon:yes gene_type:complete